MFFGWGRFKAHLWQERIWHCFATLRIVLEGLCGLSHIIPILLTKSLQLINRIKRTFSWKLWIPTSIESCNGCSHNSNFIAYPRNPYWNTKRSLKMACIISKTINITAKILAEISLEMDKLRITVLWYRGTIDYLLLKYNLGCQQLPGICLALMCQIVFIPLMVNLMIYIMIGKNLSNDF